jgi:hypothetical protein
MVWDGSCVNNKISAMHNPFMLLSPSLLVSYVKSGNGFFVRQTFQRGLSVLDPLTRAAFLITQYNDYGQAKTHYDELHKDPNRFLYNLNDAEHYQKLQVAASQPHGYKIYTPTVSQPWKPTTEIANNIRTYISRKTNWSPKRNELVKADLCVRFGELFVTLRYSIHAVTVPLAAIEKL